MATDPSASCDYGIAAIQDEAKPRENINACLLVIDIPAGTLIAHAPEDDIVAETPNDAIVRALETDLERLESWGCFRSSFAELKTLAREQAQNECADCSSQQLATHARGELLKMISMSDFLDVAGMRPGYFERSLYQTAPSMSFDWSIASIGEHRFEDRALVLRGELLNQIKIRSYERDQLSQNPNEEARNILSHLSETTIGKSCLEKMKIPQRAVTDRPSNFSNWLAQVVSQDDFHKVVQPEVVSEPATHH
ncbi:MAG: hypothetical protein ABIR96_10815 [Bdellovibrionota bacterium]